MTKQEEIREGLLSKVKSIRNWGKCPELDPLSAEDDVEDIMKYLHDNDVVRKVERTLPRIKQIASEASSKERSAFLLGLKYAQEAIIEAGYVAVENLLKEA